MRKHFIFASIISITASLSISITNVSAAENGVAHIAKQIIAEEAALTDNDFNTIAEQSKDDSDNGSMFGTLPSIEPTTTKGSFADFEPVADPSPVKAKEIKTAAKEIKRDAIVESNLVDAPPTIEKASSASSVDLNTDTKTVKAATTDKAPKAKSNAKPTKPAITTVVEYSASPKNENTKAQPYHSKPLDNFLDRIKDGGEKPKLAISRKKPISENDIGDDKAGSISGGLDANYTYDTRDMNRLTIDARLGLPYRFSYRSYFNFDSAMGPDNSNFDTTNFYSEQNLWWNPYSPVPVDLAFQWQLLSGPANDLALFGLRYRISDTPVVDEFFSKIHLTLTSQIHALQTDFKNSEGWGMSFEHRWHLDILPGLFDDRVFIDGFLDHNLNYGGETIVTNNHHTLITESKLGIRVFGGLNAIAAFRFDETAPKHTGGAFGLEYAVDF